MAIGDTMGGGGEEGGEKEGALSPDRIAATVERLVDARLQELTAQRVKTLVEAVMKANLGWLVVWGNMCVAGTRSRARARAWCVRGVRVCASAHTRRRARARTRLATD